MEKRNLRQSKRSSKRSKKSAYSRGLGGFDCAGRADRADMHDHGHPALADLRGDARHRVALLVGQNRPLAGGPGHPESVDAVRDIVLEERAQGLFVDATVLGHRCGWGWKHAFELGLHSIGVSLDVEGQKQRPWGASP